MLVAVPIRPTRLAKSTSSTFPVNTVKTATSSGLTSLGIQYSFSASGEIRTLLLNVRPPFTSRYFSNPTHSFLIRFPLSSCQRRLSCNEVFDQQGTDANALR